MDVSAAISVGRLLHLSAVDGKNVCDAGELGLLQQQSRKRLENCSSGHLLGPIDMRQGYVFPPILSPYHRSVACERDKAAKEEGIGERAR
jgi:hypothetical protein